MMINNHQQLWQLFCYLGIGTLIGIVAEIRFILHTINKPSRLRLFFADCAFCIIACVAVFLLSLAVSDGELRLTTIVIAFVGLCVIQCTLRPLSRRLATAFQISREKINNRFTRFHKKASNFRVISLKKTEKIIKKGLHRQHKL